MGKQVITKKRSDPKSFEEIKANMKHKRLCKKQAKISKKMIKLERSRIKYFFSKMYTNLIHQEGLYLDENMVIEEKAIVATDITPNLPLEVIMIIIEGSNSIDDALSLTLINKHYYGLRYYSAFDVHIHKTRESLFNLIQGLGLVGSEPIKFTFGSLQEELILVKLYENVVTTAGYGYIESRSRCFDSTTIGSVLVSSKNLAFDRSKAKKSDKNLEIVSLMDVIQNRMLKDGVIVVTPLKTRKDPTLFNYDKLSKTKFKLVDRNTPFGRCYVMGDGDCDHEFIIPLQIYLSTVLLTDEVDLVAFQPRYPEFIPNSLPFIASLRRLYDRGHVYRLRPITEEMTSDERMFNLMFLSCSCSKSLISM